MKNSLGKTPEERSTVCQQKYLLGNIHKGLSHNYTSLENKGNTVQYLQCNIHITPALTIIELKEVYRIMMIYAKLKKTSLTVTVLLVIVMWVVMPFTTMKACLVFLMYIYFCNTYILNARILFAYILCIYILSIYLYIYLY